MVATNNKFIRFEDAVSSKYANLEKEHQYRQANQSEIAKHVSELIANPNKENIWF